MKDTLKNAQEIAEQILARAKALVLTGEKDNEEAELEAYMDFLDEHESLVEELSDLRTQLDESERSSPEFEELKKTIIQITAFYKKHLRVFEASHKNAKMSYRDVKQGQRLNAGYNPLPGNEVSSKFDIKQ
ncbi:MAG: hypothetical protein FWC70_05825 [Defluviitaleaceae bacterium]|nr:hypothetical protein [Defluviitaleaceae bacterium]